MNKIVSNDQEIIIRKTVDTSLPHGPCFIESKKKKKKEEVAEGENTSAIVCGPKNASKSSCNTVRRYETHVAFGRKRSTVILNSATANQS